MSRAQLLVGAAVLVGCQAPDHPRAAEDVAYTFARVGDDLEIAIDLAGAPSGASVFDLGAPWGGVEHPEAEVREVHAVDSAGTQIPVEKGETAWTVRHAPNERLHVVYTLTSTHRKGGHDAFHRPILEPHLIQVIGNTGILRPRHLADAKRAITVRWKLMPGWTAVSSYGDAPEVVTTATLDEFRDAVFLASDRLHLVQRAINGTRLDVAIVNDFAFGDDVLVDLATRVVTAQRAFFAEPGPPYFLITAVPLGDQTGEYGGTGLTSSFAVFLSKRFADTQNLAWLLGHELFHSWNGRVIQPDPPEELMYWFTEGFTNFYARRLLYRAGIVDLAGYVQQLDEELAQYYLSSVRDVANQEIREGFWKSHELERLPYQRGDVLALVLDRALVARGSSLDALMKALVAEGHAGGTVGVDKLLARIAALTTPAIAAQLKATIVDGALLAVDPALLAPCLAGSTRSIGRFELGFDLAAAQATKRAAGVVPGSRAAAAGLHDGDPITGWSINLGQPEKLVELQVGGRTISYLPQGDPVDVPVFAVADAKACAKIL